MDKKICLYNISKQEIRLIEKNKPKDCEIYIAESFSEIIAHSCFLIIANTENADKNDFKVFTDFYEEIKPFSEKIILLGKSNIPNGLRKKVKIYENFEEFEMNIKYIILSATSRNNRTNNYSRMLVNSIFILTQLIKHPNITTEELRIKMADTQEEVSTRTIERYIESLCMAGEFIEKDKKTKGWKMGCDGKSILLGDALDKKKFI